MINSHLLAGVSLSNQNPLVRFIGYTAFLGPWIVCFSLFITYKFSAFFMEWISDAIITRNKWFEVY